MPEIISRKEALARGLKRYFTGAACKYGHICERYVRQATCAVCENEKTKKQHARRRLRDSEWCSRKNAEMYAKHKPARLASMKARTEKATIAIRALRELGLVEDKRKKSCRADNAVKRRSYLKLTAADPAGARERRNAAALVYYWRNRDRVRAAHARRERLKTIALVAIKESGIHV